MASRLGDSRRSSNVRWSVVGQKSIFTTGIYPHLDWNLYDSRPDQNKDLPPTPEAFFRVIKSLGHGSFGSVKLVELRITGERLAMKIMDKEHCPKSLRKKELNVYVQIGESPFIVRFHSCFQTEKACYLLMQYHSGGSLAKVLEDYGMLSEETTRFFTAEVSEGLLYLHGRGIIHRDIKLANLLLGTDNHVRICDMGLCKLGMVGKAKTHTRCGALRYCAPEVLCREWYGKEVDWWSLGVVLFRLITGEYPFDGVSRLEIEEMIQGFDPSYDLIPGSSCRDITKKFLCRDPEKRLGYGNCENAIHQHPFFSTIRWEDLQARKVMTPSVQKRFIRKGSLLRRLAFGQDDSKLSASRVFQSRILRLLLRVLLVVVVVALAVLAVSPKLSERLFKLRPQGKALLPKEEPASK